MSTVALIDDHESVRLGLEAACLRDGEQNVVFSGATVKEYLSWRSATGAPPAEVVVLDLTLGDGTTVTENVATLAADGASVMAVVVRSTSASAKARSYDSVIDASRRAPKNSRTARVNSSLLEMPSRFASWAVDMPSASRIAFTQPRGGRANASAFMSGFSLLSRYLRADARL